MNDPDLLFRAVADPTRRRLLHLLATGEHCVGDLVEILELPQPTVSRHLAHLRSAGFVSVRRDAQWVHYRIAKPATAVRDALLAAIRACARTPHLASDARRAKQLAQRGGCCPTTVPARAEASR